MVNKYFLTDKDFDINKFLDKNKDEDICVMNFDFNNVDVNNWQIINNTNQYDLIVLKYSNKNEKEIIIDYISNKLEEFVIIENESNIHFEDRENILYLLSVGSGSYDDYYESPKGLFKTRQKAIEYYKNHCEITDKDICKNNEIFNEIESHEPKEDDYEDYNEYWKASGEYWNKHGNITWMAEDETTCCIIKKMKIIS